jgi:hypothetical protein
MRSAIRKAISVESRASWNRNLTLPSGFDELEAPASDVSLTLAEARFAGLSPAEFAEARFFASLEHRAQAATQRAAGSPWDAIVSEYEADLAAFEGWLVERSIACGDEAFALTEIRWSLALAAVNTITELPETLEAAQRMLRSRLAWALGPRDIDDFVSRLATL